MISWNKSFYFYIYSAHFFFNTLVNAQEFKTLYSAYTDQSIELDGKDHEEFWNKPLAGKEFWQNFPSDSLASQKTEVKVVHNDITYTLLLKHLIALTSMVSHHLKEIVQFKEMTL